MFLEYIYMITSVVVIVKYIFTVFICICNSKMCSLNHFCSCNTKIFAICVKKLLFTTNSKNRSGPDWSSKLKYIPAPSNPDYPAAEIWPNNWKALRPYPCMYIYMHDYNN